jgi:hypothetical protein
VTKVWRGSMASGPRVASVEGLATGRHVGVTMVAMTAKDASITAATETIGVTMTTGSVATRSSILEFGGTRLAESVMILRRIITLARESVTRVRRAIPKRGRHDGGGLLISCRSAELRPGFEETVGRRGGVTREADGNGVQVTSVPPVWRKIRRTIRELLALSIGGVVDVGIPGRGTVALSAPRSGHFQPKLIPKDF